MLFDMRKIAQKNHLDFDTPRALSEDDFHSITGITEDQFNSVHDTISDSLRNSKLRSTRTCLAIFLAKLRTGASNSILAALFGSRKRNVANDIANVRSLLMFSFVPSHLGVNHISRADIIQNHTSAVAKAIFSPEKDSVILVADATYIYIEKSGNYQFQRRTFSVHKGRPLIKPMIIVSSSGYFVDVYGPYFADGKNNDAGILSSIMKEKHSEIRAWLREDDIFIVDRGFRDCLELLQDLGFQTKMPCFLDKGAQHTTQEGNESRLVTAVRWVVESCNFLIKTWKVLGNVLPNSQIPYAGDYVRIVCALCNAFRPPRITPTYEDTITAERMLALATQENHLQRLVEDNHWDKRRVVYQEVTDSEILDFPRLTYEELQQLTLGVYQLKQSRSYTNEHLQADGLYHLFYLREDTNILRISIQSRHTSSKQWSLWIKFTSGFTPVFQWYCRCKVGARVVECCAHIASVLWFLGFWRHQHKDNSEINRPAVESIKDAAAVRGWSDASDEEPSEEDDSDEHSE